MAEKRYVIVVSGLGDDLGLLRLCTFWWRVKGLTPIVFLPYWYIDKNFEPKLKRLLTLIDETAAKGKVDIVGISAGASAALNAFVRREKAIGRAVSVCGRLKTGIDDRFMIQQKLSLVSSPAFLDSVRRWQTTEAKLSPKERERILTVRARFWDEFIPEFSATIKGATNVTIPSRMHTLTIVLSLTVFSQKIFRFLKK